MNFDSCAQSCCGSTPVVNVPGNPGNPGANGTNGVSSFALLGQNISPVPNDGVSTGSVTVSSTTWMAIGQILVIGKGFRNSTIANFGPFTFVTTTITDATHVTLTRVATIFDSLVLALDSGATITPSGTHAELQAALPSVITDSSSGVASDVIAREVGCFTLSIPLKATNITGLNINSFTIFKYVPGFRFKLLKASASVSDAFSATPSKAYISVNSNSFTQLVLSPSAGYAVGYSISGLFGAKQPIGSETDALTVYSLMTDPPFSDGAFVLCLNIQNLDYADAIASLSKDVNALISGIS